MTLEWCFVILCTLAAAKAQEGYSRDNPANQLAYNNHGYNSEEQEMSGGEIPGEAGKDYPIYSEIPETRFDCDQQQFPGYYADGETRCQVFHICKTGEPKSSFICPNGTVFNQEKLVCDWWFNFECAQAENFYSVNEAVVRAMEQVDRLAAEKKASEGYRYNTQNGHNGYSAGGPGGRPQAGFEAVTVEAAPARGSYGAHSSGSPGSSRTPARPVHGAPEVGRRPAVHQASSFNARQTNGYAAPQDARITDATFGRQYGAEEPSREYLPANI